MTRDMERRIANLEHRAGGAARIFVIKLSEHQEIAEATAELDIEVRCEDLIIGITTFGDAPPTLVNLQPLSRR